MDPQQQNPQGQGHFAQPPVVYDQYGNPLPVVGYDRFGNPLYAGTMQQMPQQQYQEGYQPPMHHGGGHHEMPPEPEPSEEQMRLHEESRRKYPQLNLTKGEYVIRSVERHPVGMFKAWGIAAMLMMALGLFVFGIFRNDSGSSVLGSGEGSGMAVVIAMVIMVMLSLLVIGGAAVATYVYQANKFYLTNESVIQEIRASIFSRFEQTVTLANVEDVSYTQDGIIPSMFNYGTIRLSTVGDESTYHFTYVRNPKYESAIMNNAVELFKHGRPVMLADDPSFVALQRHNA